MSASTTWGIQQAKMKHDDTIKNHRDGELSAAAMPNALRQNKLLTQNNLTDALGLSVGMLEEKRFRIQGYEKGQRAQHSGPKASSRVGDRDLSALGSLQRRSSPGVDQLLLMDEVHRTDVCSSEVKMINFFLFQRGK